MCVSTNMSPFKGIFSDSNNIFLWYESADINKKSLFPKFQLIPILRFQVMHDYVYTENINLSKKRVLFDKLSLVMHMNFLIIQENKAENLFMLLDELF